MAKMLHLVMITGNSVYHNVRHIVTRDIYSDLHEALVILISFC